MGRTVTHDVQYARRVSGIASAHPCLVDLSDLPTVEERLRLSDSRDADRPLDAETRYPQFVALRRGMSRRRAARSYGQGHETEDRSYTHDRTVTGRIPVGTRPCPEES